MQFNDACVWLINRSYHSPSVFAFVIQVSVCSVYSTDVRLQCLRHVKIRPDSCVIFRSSPLIRPDVCSADRRFYIDTDGQLWFGGRCIDMGLPRYRRDQVVSHVPRSRLNAPPRTWRPAAAVICIRWMNWHARAAGTNARTALTNPRDNIDAAVLRAVIHWLQTTTNLVVASERVLI